MGEWGVGISLMRRLVRRLGTFCLAALVCAASLDAPREQAGCGTTQHTAAEVLFLHRLVRRSQARSATAAPPSASTNRDIGNVAIIENSGGVVETLNQFNLDKYTLTFTPAAASAAAYRYSLTPLGYDAAASAQGSPIVALGDDDSRQIALPFPFPFFGATYRQVFLNSDGNLTFTAGDSASSGRSVGRMTGGPPRIAPLFEDLDPSRPGGGGVRFFADASHAVFSWVNVAEYVQFGEGPAVTFQVRLYVDGGIQFSYVEVNPPFGPASAVVGIAPGVSRDARGTGGTELVDFIRGDPAAAHSGALIERFGNTQDIDVVSVAQKFYETHEDAYDYLVIYNNLNIAAAPAALAYESTVRSSGAGYGVAPADYGAEYGSSSRLRAVLNMGPLTNYPLDPNAPVPLRASSQDTPLTVLGHEAGHLFLAYASVPDGNDGAVIGPTPQPPTTQPPTAQPMIGFGGSHWSFVFNSEASLDEGEQIADRGAGTPRFLTTAVTQGYAPLDRYLMGLGPASDVPPTFVVKNYPSFISPLGHPSKGAAFDGTPVPITVGDVAQAMGRRTPDYTVAQHRYRFAFVLVVAQGSNDAQAALLATSAQQVEQYRQQFVPAYANFSAKLGEAETTLNKSMRLSLFPAAGVVAGAATMATLTLASAPKIDMPVSIATPNGYAQVVPTVTVAAGAKSAVFAITGVNAGVEQLTATPADASYETAFARVQVAAAGQLTLRAISGDNQVATGAAALAAPVVVSLSDANGLVYAGARITASASGASGTSSTPGGGSVTPAVSTTDGAGQVSFRWAPVAGEVNTLTLAVEVAPAVTLRLNAGGATPVIAAVVNAGSSQPGMAPGSLETIYGLNLAGAAVSLNGVAVKLLYRGETQINFHVPADAALGAGTLTAIDPAGVVATARVTLTPADPGIFAGAVLHAGTGVSADSTPARAGEYLEIYCTGLGPTRASGGLNVTTVTPTVYIGAMAVTPAYSGLAPGFVGLYQVDVRLPVGLAPGRLPVVISSGKQSSNEVRITVE